ncbi:MAG: T9SS type A sorting domain-containing protein [Bacteroidota bacterium]|nr:T9SS type A sorting domain-containing protein [Bacteroidota bacterium]
MRLILFCLFILNLVPGFSQVPPNDDCNGALIVVPGGSAVSTSNVGATQSREGCSGSAEDDIWFKFTASAQRQLISVVTGDSISPVIEVFVGDCSSLTSYKCFTPYFQGKNWGDLLGLAPGNTYYFRVYGAGTNNVRGRIFASVISLPDPPANDNCGNFLSIPVNTDSASTLRLTGNFGYASVGSPSCSDPLKPAVDLWYSFTAVSTAHTITAVSTSGDRPEFVVYNGVVCSSLPTVACAANPGSATNSITLTSLSPGTSYAVRLYNANSDGSPELPGKTFQLFVTTPLVPPVNDDCIGAMPVQPAVPGQIPVTIATTSVGATQSLPGCAGVAEDDIWFKFTATNSHHLITVTGSLNPVIEVFSGTCGSLTPLGCFANTQAGPIALTVKADLGNLIPGQTYFYRTYGYSGNNARGLVQTNVSSFPSSPVNDECVNAIQIPVLADTSSQSSFNGNAAYASQSMPACTDPSYVAPDVWFKFIATSSVQKISVIPGNNVLGDFAFEVLSGSCGQLQSIACVNNGSYGATDSTTINNLQKGNTYYIRLYDYHERLDSTYNKYNLIVSGPSATMPPPVNDECVTAISIQESTYANPSPKYSGVIGYATPSLGNQGLASPNEARDVWFSFTPSETRETIRVIPSGNWQVAFDIHGNGCFPPGYYYSALGQKAGDTASATYPGFIRGQTYRIRVYPVNGIADSTEKFKIAIFPSDPPTGQGLSAIYYNGNNFEQFRGARLDSTINFEYTYSKQPVVLSPWPGIVNEDHFSARWNARLKAPATQEYTIYTNSDDGIRVWVRGQLLIDNWTNQGVTEKSAKISMNAGEFYEITVEYYENTGESVTKLLWSAPTIPKQIIPRSVLYLPEFSLFEAPGCPFSTPQFRDDTINSGQADTLRWYAPGNAIQYEVYLWKGDTVPLTPTAIVGTNYYVVPANLESGVYYWTVELKNFSTLDQDCSFAKRKLTVLGKNSSSTGTGLNATYYNGTNLSGTPLLQRVDPTINFELTYSKQPVVLSPAPGIVPEDLYSVRWTGKVQPNFSETYTFYTVSDDGIRLWVNGQLLVDNWVNQGATEKSGTISLVAGQFYDIVVEYYENTGEAVTKLLWSSTSTPKQIIPSSQLYPEAPAVAGVGLLGTYFDGKTLSGTPLLTRTDPTVNMELTYTKQPVVMSPAPGIVPEDQFSVRWTGKIQAQYSELYRFYTVSDDGVRLWVNGQLLVDNWVDQGTTEKNGTIALTAGQQYDIVIEYYENAGEAVCQLLWSSNSTPKQVVPRSQLYLPDGAAAGRINQLISQVQDRTAGVQTNAGVMLFPNPVRTGQAAYIHFSGMASSPVQLSIATMNGTVLKSQAIKAGASMVTVATSGLASGLYIVTLRSAGNTQNFRLLIQ